MTLSTSSIVVTPVQTLAMPAFTPATADDLAAARAAVKAAEDSRKAECEARGKHWRAREETELQKHAALAATLANKATTDRAAKLDADATAIRAQLASTPAVKDANPLGNALARLPPWLPAASAATYQQAVISLIAELLIAAGLALPELLRRAPNAVPAARSASLAAVSSQGNTMAPEPADAGQQAPAAVSVAMRTMGTRKGLASIAGVPLAELPKPEHASSVGRFMLACLPRTSGHDEALASIYRRYCRWCDEQQPAAAAVDVATFAAEFRPVAERVGLRTEKRGERLYVCDVRLVA